MAASPSTGETLSDVADVGAEKERELATIDNLMSECRGKLGGVSGTLISQATKSSLDRMWRELRSEAERDDLRAERLAWAKGAMAFLEDNIDKAAEERRQFEADLAHAVEKKWMRADSAAEWIQKFEDPDLLEMRRSAWIRNEWAGYKARWQKLAHDRTRVLGKAAAAGLTAKDIPELASLKNDDAFLAKKYPARRSLVDAIDAAVAAVPQKKMVLLRKTETMLVGLTAMPDRCLHPSKVGQWLKRMMYSGEPETFRATVLEPFVANWKNARAGFDGVVADYEAQGKPDGCMPMALNAFLQLPYDARMATLAETRNRLTAAKKLESGEDGDLARELREIRRSVDLKDLDAADLRLAGLRVEHPDDPDVRSISDHVAALRAERDKDGNPEQTVAERTDEALASLRDTQEKLPSSVAALYKELIESGDAEKAALVFASMKVHADRVRSGQLSKEEAAVAARDAEDAEEATIVERAPAEGMPREGDGDDESLLVSAGTPPATTIALLKERGARDPKRFPGLVFDLPADQHLQLVEHNERTLADLRHLSSVGKRYGASESHDEALAA